MITSLEDAIPGMKAGCHPMMHVAAYIFHIDVDAVKQSYRGCSNHYGIVTGGYPWFVLQGRC